MFNMTLLTSAHYHVIGHCEHVSVLPLAFGSKHSCTLELFVEQWLLCVVVVLAAR